MQAKFCLECGAMLRVNGAGSNLSGHIPLLAQSPANAEGYGTCLATRWRRAGAGNAPTMRSAIWPFRKTSSVGMLMMP
jgi:hypothetical protein